MVTTTDKPSAGDDDLAFQLCAEWQVQQHRQHGFAIDELSAFMAGVKAALRSRPPVAGAEVIKTHIDSALNWHEIFDDGRGQNNLTKSETSEMLCRRLLASLSPPVAERDGGGAQCALALINAGIERIENDKRVLFPDNEILYMLEDIRTALTSTSPTPETGDGSETIGGGE